MVIIFIIEFKLKVSVIIPVFNGAVLIERCLDAVFSQNLPKDTELEVIVIDDGSTDETVSLLHNYRHQIKVLGQRRKGPAAARNQGILDATGDYLAFLDADDYWYPDFILETTGFLIKYPAAMAVSVGQLHKFASNEGTILPAFLRGKEASNMDGLMLNDFFSFWAIHNHICTGSALIRMEVIHQAGGQLEDMRITEDLEYWAYLSTFGTWGFLPKVLFVSDGDKVTKKIGWWKKKRERWHKAPDLDTWENRLLTRLEKPLSENYLFCRARVGKSLGYAALLSGRLESGRSIILSCKNHLPNDKLSILLKYGSKNKLQWWILSKVLIYREKNRKI
ncbi:glycosyltransferase family 2 protein [uncultured Cyclobacterium sp.]|uniref:glycosyltransferase family 2 protein n=1 Tax=uncultured Cyclobacterium sp. TaxID=453820 RepID=UPI0030EC5583